jgi:hypothetical protein
LACQSLVESSVVVLTRPQSGLANGEAAWGEALQQPLPPGPLAWPEPDVEDAPPEEEPGTEPQSKPTTTTDEAPPLEDRTQ